MLRKKPWQMLLDVDLSQIEWRVEACLTDDRVMIEEIRNNVDQHAAAAKDLMGLKYIGKQDPESKKNRDDAKVFNFRAIYANPKTAAFAYFKDPRMPSFSKKKWQQILDGFFAKYHGMASKHDEWVNTVYRTGQLVGPTGRIWKFEKEIVRGVEDYSVTKIRNYPVQGTAGDIIKLAMVYIAKALRRNYPNAKLVMTVHDSLVIDAPECDIEGCARLSIDIFNKIPELVFKHYGWKMPVPITGEADAGPSWAEMRQII